MSEESAFTVCIVVVLGFLAFGLQRGCESLRANDGQRAAIQVECIKAGHPVLECKELR